MISGFKIMLIRIFCIASQLPVYGQITGNLNVKDSKALEITPTVIEMICGKEWWGLKIKENKRGEKEERDNRETIKFLCNGDVDGKNGKWEVINQLFIKITRPAEKNTTISF